MSRKEQREKPNRAEGASPAAGILFLVGGFGFFYSFITVVDPLL